MLFGDKVARILPSSQCPAEKLFSHLAEAKGENVQPTHAADVQGGKLGEAMTIKEHMVKNKSVQ